MLQIIQYWLAILKFDTSNYTVDVIHHLPDEDDYYPDEPMMAEGDDEFSNLEMDEYDNLDNPVDLDTPPTALPDTSTLSGAQPSSPHP